MLLVIESDRHGPERKLVARMLRNPSVELNLKVIRKQPENHKIFRVKTQIRRWFPGVYYFYSLVSLLLWGFVCCNRGYFQASVIDTYLYAAEKAQECSQVDPLAADCR